MNHNGDGFKRSEIAKANLGFAIFDGVGLDAGGRRARYGVSGTGSFATATLAGRSCSGGRIRVAASPAT